jgi:uncharacterized coiled-coil DUF342 family protein
MVTRHRIPTIFNLSMVDVLCCALGCVILLWLINLREAKQRALAAGQAAEQLALTRTRLSDTDTRLRSAEQQIGTVTLSLKSTQSDRDRAAARAVAAEKERDLLHQDLGTARGQIEEMKKDAAGLREQLADVQDRLAKKTKDHGEQATELAVLRKRATELDVLLREKETTVRSAVKSAEDLAQRLHDADARLAQMRSQAELLPGLRAEAQASRDKLTTTDARVQALQKELSERDLQLASAGRAIDTLRDERKTLADQAIRARAAVENRFAGIALTGRRVVFLVDMSGSMEMVDENTLAPDKWQGVRQTVAQIMRSLPDLEKFQVILFAANVRYLLGNDRRWIDYDPVTSTGRVAEALAATKPLGNTDMYAGFEEAFHFRPIGLDTIYVFSDGLPNVGRGLTAQAAATLKETERTEILSKYVRQTLRISWNRTQIGQPRVRINTVGFFFESPDVGAFLWALARENDGSFVGMSKP